MPSSRGSSWPRDQTCISGVVGRFLTVWVTRLQKGRFALWSLIISRNHHTSLINFKCLFGGCQEQERLLWGERNTWAYSAIKHQNRENFKIYSGASCLVATRYTGECNKGKVNLLFLKACFFFPLWTQASESLFLVSKACFNPCRSLVLFQNGCAFVLPELRLVDPPPNVPPLTCPQTQQLSCTPSEGGQPVLSAFLRISWLNVSRS